MNEKSGMRRLSFVFNSRMKNQPTSKYRYQVSSSSLRLYKNVSTPRTHNIPH